MAAGGAVDTNSVVIVITSSQSDLFQSNTQTLETGLTGTKAGDQFYLAFDDGSNTAIYRMADTNSDLAAFENSELIATLNSITDADAVLDTGSFGL